MTAQEFINKYRLVLIGENNIASCKYPDSSLEANEDFLRFRPEIFAILRAEKEAKKKALAELRADTDLKMRAYFRFPPSAQKALDERKAKIRAIEGLDELRYAPKELEERIKAEYPRAAAYLKAESYSLSENDGKFTAGKKAVDRIINGEDYAAVIADMEKEWSDYCRERVCDENDN